MKEEIVKLLPVIRRFAYSLTGSTADADDLVQNTVERVLTRALPDDVDLTKWVFRVCRNLWIDEYRSRKVRQNATQNPELQEQQSIDGETEIHRQMEVEQVHQAMDNLVDDERCLIALIALQGMSYKEAAETLKIPLGTVMSRLARARRNIVNWLQQQQLPSAQAPNGEFS
jgi:RNA polymerase sigma factor (sigma-70 family)